MLKYHNKHDKKCKNDKPNEYKLADCNKKLLTNIGVLLSSILKIIFSFELL